MKKIVLLFILVILVSGCEKEVIKTCKIEADGLGYKLQSEYIIYGTGKKVDKVISTEIIISDNQEILNRFEDTLTDSYKLIQETYGGYELNITNQSGIVTSKVTINYSEVDMGKYLSDNSTMKNYVTKDNNLLISGLEEYYISTGAVCE